MVEITRSFEIEVEMIDNDHRRLVEIINEITQAIDDDRPEECARRSIVGKKRLSPGRQTPQAPRLA